MGRRRSRGRRWVTNVMIKGWRAEWRVKVEKGVNRIESRVLVVFCQYYLVSLGVYVDGCIRLFVLSGFKFDLLVSKSDISTTTPLPMAKGRILYCST